MKMKAKFVQKEEMNIAGLTLARLGLGWNLRTWILGVSITLTDKSGSLFLNCLCRPYSLCQIPAFLLEVWNLNTCQAEGAYMGSPQ